MRINARFLCDEVAGNARPGEYELPDGADIASFMRTAAEENGTFCENYMNHIIFTVNFAPAVPTTVLHDGDRVIVLRRVYGG